jgi:methionyl-tRNA formyltransferase
LRFVFLGSPPFATPVLARLCESRHRALALVTPPDRPRGRGRGVEASSLIELARSRAIPVLQPADVHAPEALAELRALGPDVLVVASFGVILKPALLSLAPRGALNVHASLLPRHRGASPIQAAILCGDPTTGVSVQRIVQRLDEGDVLCARERTILPEETAGELLASLASLGGEAIVEGLDRLEDSTAVFTPQDPSRATYARKLEKEHGHIDFSRSDAELARHVRAMNPWPMARCLDPRGRELSLLRARVSIAQTPPASQPGRLLEARTRMVLATGEGALEAAEVLPAGKRPMSGVEFLRGARLEVGELFGALPARPLPYRREG